MKNIILICVCICTLFSAHAQRLLNPYTDVLENYERQTIDQLVGFPYHMSLNNKVIQIECTAGIPRDYKIAAHFLADNAEDSKYFNGRNGQLNEQSRNIKLSISLFLKRQDASRGLLYLKQITKNNEVEGQLFEVFVEYAGAYTWKIAPIYPEKYDFSVVFRKLQIPGKTQFGISINYYLNASDMELLMLHYRSIPKVWIQPQSTSKIETLKSIFKS